MLFLFFLVLAAVIHCCDIRHDLTNCVVFNSSICLNQGDYFDYEVLVCNEYHPNYTIGCCTQYTSGLSSDNSFEFEIKHVPELTFHIFSLYFVLYENHTFVSNGLSYRIDLFNFTEDEAYKINVLLIESDPGLFNVKFYINGTTIFDNIYYDVNVNGGSLFCIDNGELHSFCYDQIRKEEVPCPAQDQTSYISLVIIISVMLFVVLFMLLAVGYGLVVAQKNKE